MKPWERYQQRASVQEAAVMPKDEVMKPWEIYQQRPSIQEDAPSPMAPPLEQEPSPIGAMYKGVEQGITFGFADELQSAIAAGIASTSPELTYGEAYEQAKEIFKKRREQAAESHPWFYYPGEMVGGITTGGLGAAKIGGRALARQFAKKPIRTGAATGAISGGIYGTGAGEGTIPERLTTGGEAAALGLGTGAAGAYLAPKISRAVGAVGRKIFPGARTPTDVSTPPVEEVIERAEMKAIAPRATFVGEEAAQAKVIKALKADYPENWQRILQAAQEENIPLAKLGGPRIRTLAKGAAQYPSGQAVIERHLVGDIAEMPERIKSAINKNISSAESYFYTADDIVRSGQKKAAPLYEKSYRIGAIDDPQINTMLVIPEIKKSIVEGIKIQKLVSAAKGEDFDSAIYNVTEEGELFGRLPTMKLLDTAKKGLDTLIDEEIDPVTEKITQYGRALIKLRNSYVENLDRVNPFYKEARTVAGDYLKVREAMDEGRKFMKLDSELIGRKLKKMSSKEKEAYKIGVGKQLRDIIESPTGGVRNPYDKVFRGIEQQKKLSKILSATEYTNLEKAIKSEDKLFRLRNEVLGGSPTASKQVAAAEIATGGADLAGMLATGDLSGTLGSTIRNITKRAFDGLSDNTADAVSRLLFENDPVKKVKLLDATLGSKALDKTQKKLLKESYFAMDELIKGQQRAATASGVAAAEIMKERE